MTNYSETRESVDALLQKIFPDMKYHGHGNNIGIWETDDMLDLTKPISDSYWNAKFRLWVFIPNKYGMQIKVEAFIIHVCEWETMFEGYIEDISDIRRILGMQLGLPLKETSYRRCSTCDPVCDINGLRISQLKAMDKEQMTERVRTDVRNLAIEAGCDIKTAWDKLERLMPDLHDYRPVTDEEKQKWYNI